YDPKSNKIIDAEDPIPLDKPYPTENVNGLKRIYPINSRNEERVWRSSYLTGRKRAKNGELFLSSSGTVYQSITHENKREVLFSNWTDSKFNAGKYGSELLSNLGLGNEFDYPKSIHTMEVGLIAQTEAERDSLILDFFAGSGTTAHATLKLNRRDNGERKFILVEMGNHFYNAILPRVSKVIYSDNWKDGIPVDNKGSPKQIIKYHSLEQYEDSLQNIDFKIPNALAIESKDYPIKYMLDFESRDNPIFLDIDMLNNPFDYKLKIETDNGIKNQKVDLIETFNYIAGIFVDSINKTSNDEIDYVIVKGHRDEKNVIVIWRNKPESFDPEKDKKFIEETVLNDGEYDEILVNGNSLVENAKSLDEIFKKGMFGWD
ncbi:MAG: DNA methyltransferase, partial [Candidatus Lokiarchaeota archaeon]